MASVILANVRSLTLRAETVQNLGSHPDAYLYTWIYLNLIPNTIILPLLVATFLFSKSANRHPTLINVCVTWIWSGVFSCLLFYAGEHVGDEPSSGLCIAQTTLLYGITPGWSVAVFMLIYYMSFTLDADPLKRNISNVKLVVMLAAPYVTQVTFSIACLVTAVQHPYLVNRQRRYLYCSLKDSPLSDAMSIFTFAMCLAILVLEAKVVWTLSQRRGLRKAGSRSVVDVQVLMRVLGFVLYILLGMIVSLVSVFQVRSVLPDMYVATVGSVLLLIFGMQRDVFLTWLSILQIPYNTLRTFSARLTHRRSPKSQPPLDLFGHGWGMKGEEGQCKPQGWHDSSRNEVIVRPTN